LEGLNPGCSLRFPHATEVAEFRRHGSRHAAFKHRRQYSDVQRDQCRLNKLPFFEPDRLLRVFGKLHLIRTWLVLLDLHPGVSGVQAMIIRLFRGQVKPEKLSSLDQVLREVTIPLLEARPGLVSYYVGGPMESNPHEFLVLTVWTDLQALKAFAGARWQESVIPERMADLLQAAFVYHYSEFHGG
jgi:quinol monooxygenase YgiN